MVQVFSTFLFFCIRSTTIILMMIQCVPSETQLLNCVLEVLKLRQIPSQIHLHHFKGKVWIFISIKHLVSYIVRGTSSEALQKLLEMTPSNLKTERRTLQNIFANVVDRLLATFFSEGLATLYERLNGVWFFHINSSLCCSPEVKVQWVQIWTVSWPGIFRPSAEDSTSDCYRT